MNYYNEFDKDAATWLRALMDEGLIPKGEIDERSITEVEPGDLAGFRQCHFFAGIGGWPLALQLAGWPDDRPVWTGSCPCQPFSVAGKGLGERDERHLWPVFRDLIAQCRPSVVFGEQVASAKVIGKQGKGCRVSTALSAKKSREGFNAARQNESAQKGGGIRLGRTPSGTARSYRQRLLRDFWPSVQPRWWEDVGQSIIRQDQPGDGVHLIKREGSSPCREQRNGGLGRCKDAGDRPFDHGAAASALQRAIGAARAELDAETLSLWLTGVRFDLEEIGYTFGACNLSAAGVGAPHIRQRLFWMANADGTEWDRSLGESESAGRAGFADGGWLVHADDSGSQGLRRDVSRGGQSGRIEKEQAGPAGAAGESGHWMVHADVHRFIEGSEASSSSRYRNPADATGIWSESRLILCRDGKHRRIPTEPSLFPLADGLSYRVGARRSIRPALLKGAGNAIVPQVAAEFIKSFLEL